MRKVYEKVYEIKAYYSIWGKDNNNVSASVTTTGI